MYRVKVPTAMVHCGMAEVLMVFSIPAVLFLPGRKACLLYPESIEKNKYNGPA